MSPFILEKRLSPFFLQTSPFCKKNGDICKINGDICKKNGDICKKNGDNLFCHRFCIPPDVTWSEFLKGDAGILAFPS